MEEMEEECHELAEECHHVEAQAKVMANKLEQVTKKDTFCKR